MLDCSLTTRICLESSLGALSGILMGQVILIFGLGGLGWQCGVSQPARLGEIFFEAFGHHYCLFVDPDGVQMLGTLERVIMILLMESILVLGAFPNCLLCFKEV